VELSGLGRAGIARRGCRERLNRPSRQAYKSDTTFFNGAKIGETPEADNHDYLVPGKLVKAGRNVIAVRIKGSDGFVGMYSDDATS